MPPDQPGGKPRWAPADSPELEQLHAEMRKRQSADKRRAEFLAALDDGRAVDMVAYTRRKDGERMIMATLSGRRVFHVADSPELLSHWNTQMTGQNIRRGLGRALGALLNFVRSGLGAADEVRSWDPGRALARELFRALSQGARGAITGGNDAGFDRGR